MTNEIECAVIVDSLPEPLETAQVLTRYQIMKNLIDSTFPDALTEQLGKGYFKIDFEAQVNTGADISKYFSIPFMHKLHRVEFKHTDSAYADSVNALTYTMKYGSTHNRSLLFTIISNTGTTVSDTAHLFNDFWRGTSRYELKMNTTNTELVYVSMLIEIQDDPATGE